MTMKNEINRSILEVLERTKENEVLTDLTDLERDNLLALNLIQSSNATYIFSRENRIDLAMIAVERGVDDLERL